MPKLNYKIVKRERPEGQVHTDFEAVHVEWTHADGPVKDTKLVPKTHPPEIKYEEVPDGERKVIHDQLNVKPGTPDSIVMQMCEEKRAALAKALGVEA